MVTIVRPRKESRALREAMATREVISISDDNGGDGDDEEDLRSSDWEFKGRNFQEVIVREEYGCTEYQHLPRLQQLWLATSS